MSVLPTSAVFAVALAMLSLAGCDDSGTAPLPVNGTAILSDPEEDVVGILTNHGTEYATLPSGTRVVVLEDAPAEPPTRPEHRPVKARILDGENKGLEFQVSRDRLRSAR